uniref:E3 ubiquitin-protein ligase RHF2A n=1 Tax=Rhizophora mucronata TaxID=61149 RepID=A0A2P2LQD1_RHIMU
MQLPIGTNDAELEEHIIQHLAAAAAMGRRQIARREGHRNRSSGQGRPQFLVFSSHPNAPTSSPISTSPTQRGEGEAVSSIAIPIPSSPTNFREDSSQLTTLAPTDVQANSASASVSGSAVLAANAQGNSSNNRSPPSSQDRAGPSDFQSFSESFKSKFNAFSMRYKDSISKSTRGWKERFFSRNTAAGDLGSEVRREVNAGIATVSQMMERLETRDNSRTSSASVSNGADGGAVVDLNNQRTLEAGGSNHMNDTTTTTNNMQTSCAASSGSN